MTDPDASPARPGLGLPYRERALPVLLFALVAQLLAAGFLPPLDEAGRLLFTAVVVANYLAMLYALSRGRMLWLAAFLLVPSVVGAWTRDLQLPEWIALAGIAGSVAFYALVIAVVFDSMLRSPSVRLHELAGAASVYLLLGLGFAEAFELVERVWPGSFRSPDAMGPTEFAYFSFVTLTTLGYGDVVPVAGLARSLVVLETVLGVLYPAVVVSRLVSLFVTGGTYTVSPSPGRWWQHTSRNLAVLLLLAVFLFPALQGNDLERGDRGEWPFLDLGILVAVLYGASRDIRVVRAGAVIGALAVVSFVSSGGGDRYLVIGTGFQLVLFAIGLAVLFAQILRSPVASRDILWAALCVYLLLGLAGAYAFALVELLAPGSISFPDARLSTAEVVYYSFMTLTTTGYGEMAPLTPASRILASLVATLGVLYPAVLVARLVSLYDQD